jgi:SAM-dependent methyltransferase
MTDIISRIDREKHSYDEGTVHAESTKLHVRFPHVFHSPNSERLERHFRDGIAARASGADLLDYGCYNGWMAPHYARLGPRKITGIDISEKGIELARRQYGTLADFQVGDAHAMPFPDDSFDLVVGRAILHHLDYETALDEIRRVLRPGGGALFIEPLRDNPGAKLARAVTPKARTPDELPLSAGQIRYGDLAFGRNDHFFCNLVSVPVALLTSLVARDSPANWALQLSDVIDVGLARTPARYWMRLVSLAWTKT